MWTYDFMQWLTFGRCHGCNTSQLYLCIESCHSCWLRSTGCTNLPMCSLSVPLTDPTWSILHYWDPAGTTFNSLSFLLCLSLLLASSDLTWLLVAELILMCGAHVANTRLHCAMIWLDGYVIISVCLSVSRITQKVGRFSWNSARCNPLVKKQSTCTLDTHSVTCTLCMSWRLLVLTKSMMFTFQRTSSYIPAETVSLQRWCQKFRVLSTHSWQKILSTVECYYQ